MKKKDSLLPVPSALGNAISVRLAAYAAGIHHKNVHTAVSSRSPAPISIALASLRELRTSFKVLYMRVLTQSFFHTFCGADLPFPVLCLVHGARALPYGSYFQIPNRALQNRYAICNAYLEGPFVRNTSGPIEGRHRPT